jgi:hypothetical protein
VDERWHREQRVYFGVVMSLRALALVSAAYDFALSLPLLLAPAAVARAFGAAPPDPVINAQLNGMFTLTLAAGYLWAAGDAEARRGYLWVAGVLAKGLGAALFLLDHFTHGSPPAFLVFAATDGTLALLTLGLLLRQPAAARAATGGAASTAAPGLAGGTPPR